MSIQSPATAPVAGNAPATEDLGPLAWVLGEIQKSLDDVSKTLRRFAREAPAAPRRSTPAPLRLARQQLHQAVGALQMVGHPAPALVLGAMEFAVQSFVTEPARCTDAAVQKIDRAGFAVTDFLQRAARRQDRLVGGAVPAVPRRARTGRQRTRPPGRPLEHDLALGRDQARAARRPRWCTTRRCAPSSTAKCSRSSRAATTMPPAACRPCAWASAAAPRCRASPASGRWPPASSRRWRWR